MPSRHPSNERKLEKGKKCGRKSHSNVGCLHCFPCFPSASKQLTATCRNDVRYMESRNVFLVHEAALRHANRPTCACSTSGLALRRRTCGDETEGASRRPSGGRGPPKGKYRGWGMEVAEVAAYKHPCLASRSSGVRCRLLTAFFPCDSYGRGRGRVS